MEDANDLDAWNEVDLANVEPIDIEEMDSLMLKFVELRKQKDDLDDKSSAIGKQIEEIKAKIIPILEQHKKDGWEVRGVGKIGLRRTKLCSVPKNLDSKDKLFHYLSQFGKDVMLSMLTVNHNTLTSFYKVEQEKAQERGEVFQMPGVEQPYEMTNLSFYALKGKKEK